MQTTLGGLLLAGLLALTSAAAEPCHDAAACLSEGRADVVDTQLSALQRRFEAGTADEIELRNAYRPFYKLDDLQLAALQHWAARSPKSYPARLALGVYYRHEASQTRGTQYAEDTPAADLQRSQAFAAKARVEFDASMNLTATPYLTVFHQMEIDALYGSHDDLRRDERLAARMLPFNTLARIRYVAYSTPRWGGSYEIVDAFIAHAHDAGVAAPAIREMEALELDDKAKTFQEHGDNHAAMDAYRAAADKAALAGGDVLTNELGYARKYVCRYEPQHPYCPDPRHR